MKNYLVILIIINFLFCISNAEIKNNYDDFMKSIKLNQKQTEKIEDIEKTYNKELVLLDAQIMLKKMQLKQISNKHKYQDSAEIRQLEKQRNDIYEQKNQEILSSLNFFQKRKFKKFIIETYKNSALE